MQIEALLPGAKVSFTKFGERYCANDKYFPGPRQMWSNKYDGMSSSALLAACPQASHTPALDNLWDHPQMVSNGCRTCMHAAMLWTPLGSNACMHTAGLQCCAVKGMHAAAVLRAGACTRRLQEEAGHACMHTAGLQCCAVKGMHA